MNDAVHIVELEEMSPVQRDMILAPLDQHAAENGHPYSERQIALSLDDGDHLEGGLIGRIAWGWMFIEILSVPASLRGRGIGRRLVENAEDIARKSECTGIWLDTISFQAPGFYERLGFERFGELRNHPGNETRIFFRKLLD